MTPDAISPELIAVFRRLKLGRLLATLPERLVLARQQHMAHQDFLLLLLHDEVARRDSAAVTLRATQAQLDPTMTLEQWDPSAKVWRVVPSTLLGSTRSALLWHFSKYSAGRAGW